MGRATLLLLVALPVLAQEPANQADLDALLGGVSAISAPGCLPGNLSVYGPDAFPVMTADSGGVREALVGAASYGEGRVLAVGHDGLLGGPQDQVGNARFIANAVRWVAGGREGVTVGLRGFGAVEQTLTDAGFTVVRLSDADYRSRLAELDVLITGGYDLGGPEGAGVLRGFVEGGGGVITGVCPWGWLQVSGRAPEAMPTELDGNRLLAPMGLVFSDGMVGETAPGAYAADREGLGYAQAGQALTALAGHVDGTGAKLDAKGLRQVGVTLTTAIRSLPPDDTVFLPRLREACGQLGGETWPTPGTPVKSADPFARIGATLYLTESRRLAPKEITACPAADGFPGAVAEDAPRISRELDIDTAVPDWHSTGLYAPPGGLVTVMIPSAAAKAGLSVRIGCHTDGIWHLDEWKRFPEISRAIPLRDVTTEVASPFGGAVYIEVPRSCKLGPIAVGVEGAVEAPYFVRGVTGLDDWRATIRNAPAPWGELQANGVVFSLPSEVLRNLDDPEALLTFWDEVMDACADLAAIPRERPRPERYVSDVQISAGYMHSGYPIMTWLDAPAQFVDLATLKAKGNWGAFHEMGHNHQEGDWTFDGTVEVTENLFSVYVGQTVCGLSSGAGHPAMAEPAKTERLAKYLADGAKFEKWQGDPFLALTMYEELWDAFGWDAYKKVFAEYRTLAPGERPRTEAEKRDQWMVRFSRAVGRDLGPFFQAWGVPTSDAARESISDLPEWMPEGWPPKP